MADLAGPGNSRSLSFKLVCIVALAMLLAAGLMSYYFYILERRSATRHALADLGVLSEDLAARIDLSLSSCKVLAAHLACTREVADCLARGKGAVGKAKACQEWLDMQLRLSPGMSAMLLVAGNGACLAATNRAFIGRNYAFRAFYQEAMAGRFTVSDWTIGLVFHNAHIDASAPVLIDGRIAGVLVTEFPVTGIEDAIRSAGVNGRAAALIDRSGVILAHSKPGCQYHAIQPLDARAQAEFKRTRQFMDREIIVEPFTADLAEGFHRALETTAAQTVSYRSSLASKVAVLTPLTEKDWVVSVALPRDDILLPLRKALERSILVGLSASVVGLLAALAMGRWQLRPVFQLMDTMGRFGAGDTTARAPVLNRDERGRLSQAFNDMADALQANQARLEQRTQELLRSEAQFRLLFEKAPMGMAIVDSTSGRFLSVNPRMGEIMGYAPAELQTADVQSITHPDHLVSALESLTALAGGKVVEVVKDKRYLDRAGRTVWGRLRVVGLPVLHDDPPRHLALVDDITERLQTEEALAQERRHLEERVQSALADLRQKDQILASQGRLAAMGEMISNIAHQWRQPLNALSLQMANLRDAYDYGELDGPTMARFSAQGDLLIQGMSSTINDFRSFFRPDKEMAAFSAILQVQAALRLMEGSLAAADIRVRIEAAEDVLLFGFANEYCQVLLNLLSNAREAIREGGVRPGRVTIRVWTEAGFGGLAMADNGGGIPAELLDRIFEPYFSTRESGTGIGLYMSKQIIEHNMGGRIRAASGPGGAEFTVLVPVPGAGS